MEEEYLTGDRRVLWFAPTGKQPTLAMPKTSITGVLSLTHCPFGHPGVGRTPLLVQEQHCWPTLRKDV